MAVAAKARRADPADAARKRQECRVPRRKHPRPGHLVHADLRRLADAGAELSPQRSVAGPWKLPVKVIFKPPLAKLNPYDDRRLQIESFGRNTRAQCFA